MKAKSALVLSFSQVHKDPRVLRQISWLRELGFSSIAVVGSGAHPEGADSFFPVQVKSTTARYFGYFIRDHRKRFNFFFGGVLESYEEKLEQPQLLVVNEVEFLGWKFLYKDDVAKTPTYLDLHEDHINDAHSNLVEALAFKKFWEWQTLNLKKFVQTRTSKLCVTTVEAEISNIYSAALAVPVSVIMNAPDLTAQDPSPVNCEDIKLVHHGIGTRNRGIETCIKMMRGLPRNYSLTLILIQHWSYRLKIEILARLFGVRERITISPGVPSSLLARKLNQFDVALVLQSDATLNHLNSLPNKLFESIQGRLAVVCGPNPAIRSIVNKHALGVASSTWRVGDVRKSVLSMTAEDISNCKSGAHTAAELLSSRQSQAVFVDGVRGLFAD